jgi:hypothetical protein
MAAKSKSTKAPEQEAPAAEQPQSFRSYNRVQLSGRLVADSDIKYTPSEGRASDSRRHQRHEVGAVPRHRRLGRRRRRHR